MDYFQFGKYLAALGFIVALSTANLFVTEGEKCLIEKYKKRKYKKDAPSEMKFAYQNYLVRLCCGICFFLGCLLWLVGFMINWFK